MSTPEETPRCQELVDSEEHDTIQQKVICFVPQPCQRHPPPPEPPPSWDDAPIPEDAEIEAAHPLRTGRHDLYAEALRLVGAKRSKGELVELVNWLLASRAAQMCRVLVPLAPPGHSAPCGNRSPCLLHPVAHEPPLCEWCRNHVATHTWCGDGVHLRCENCVCLGCKRLPPPAQIVGGVDLPATHLVVICREGDTEATEFKTYAEADDYFDRASGNWTDSFLCEVVAGPGRRHR